MTHYTLLIAFDHNPMVEGGMSIDYPAGAKNWESDAVEKRLAPFDENISGEPYIDQTVEEIQKEMDKLKQKYAEKKDNPNPTKQETKSLKFYKRIVDGMSMDEFLDEWNGQRLGTINGVKGAVSSYNRDSKWDWYMIGGRWEGALRHKLGHDTDCLQKKDLDRAYNYKNDMEYIKERYGDEENPKPDIMKDGLQCNLPSRKDKTIKAKHMDGIFTPCAFLDLDNIWHEAGSMGWFGMQDASCPDQFKWDYQFKVLWDDLDDDTWLVLVDLHI